MRSILTILLMLFCLSCPPLGIADDRPFLAVTNNIGTYELDWKIYKPSVYKDIEYWEELDSFLEKVAKKAGDREIVLDIGCHGVEQGYLALRDRKTDEATAIASVGFLLNHIEDKLKGKKIRAVILEACFSRICMEKSFMVKREFSYINGPKIESYHGKYPTYPIYGIGKTSNYNNLVFLQYITKRKVFFEDLRNYIGHPLEAPVHDKNSLKLLSFLLGFLRCNTM